MAHGANPLFQIGLIDLNKIQGPPAKRSPKDFLADSETSPEPRIPFNPLAACLITCFEHEGGFEFFRALYDYGMTYEFRLLYDHLIGIAVESAKTELVNVLVSL